MEVIHDDKYQPIGEVSSLFVGVCGQLIPNHILFLISFESWSNMLDTTRIMCRRVH